MPLTPVKAKGWATSKTNIIAFLVMVAGIMQVVVDSGFIPADYVGYLLTAIGLIFGALRFLTDKPVASSPLKSDTAYVEGPIGRPI